jgi:hypothetical protein
MFLGSTNQLRTEICTLLGYFAVYSGNYLSKFWDNLSVLFSSVKKSFVDFFSIYFSILEGGTGGLFQNGGNGITNVHCVITTVRCVIMTVRCVIMTVRCVITTVRHVITTVCRVITTVRRVITTVCRVIMTIHCLITQKSTELICFMAKSEILHLTMGYHS